MVVSTLLTNSMLLFQSMCVIVLAAYVVTRSKYFVMLTEGDKTWKNQAVLSIFFGLLAVYGSMIGIGTSGAILNIRDLGPMVAGLTCGPVVGVGAGLIGALFRLTEGGFTIYTCSSATLLSGLLGGLIYLRKGRFPGVLTSVAFAASMEIFHMLLTVAFATPFSHALEVVEMAVVPMTLANSIGVLLYTFIISNFLNERETEVQRDSYRKELERKEAEIALAADIQKSFMPHQVPAVPGFDLAAVSLPAQDVGGDFYDFIPCPGGKLGLVIADVAGKGVPAALFMALSKIVVRTNALRQCAASEVLTDSNEVIAAESSQGMFVTLFFAALDGLTGTVSYANAGHHPPLVLRGRDSRFDPLKITGIALGILDGSKYTQNSVTLEPGDIMVMYTDGITEAMNLRGELFGTERLRSIIAGSQSLSADELIGSIVKEVTEFSAGQQQFDDITALVVKAGSRSEVKSEH